MTSFAAHIKPPPVAEYILLIEPRKDICDSIIDMKQAFSKKYKAAEAIKGKPHITLVSYAQYQSFEGRIRQRLRNLSLQTAPFSISLQNYSSLPSHTILINIATKTAVQNLVKNIKTNLQEMMKLDKDNKPYFILDPHIFIARRLKPWQYEQAWLQYSNSNFSEKFIATHFTMLRKEIGAQKFELVEKFEFQNIPVKAVQTRLF